MVSLRYEIGMINRRQKYDISFVQFTSGREDNKLITTIQKTYLKNSEKIKYHSGR